MASAIIHLCIAKKVNEIFKKNQKEFLLGSIAPDISKQIGKTKTESHFLDSEDTNIPNLNKFLKKYKTSLKNNDFDLGYYCHLFADKIWFESFLPKYYDLNNNILYYNNGKKLTIHKNKLLKLLYNDYNNLNIKMTDCYNLDLSLFYEEMPIIKTEIDEIPIDKIKIIIDTMGIIIENSYERPLIVFKKEDICKYINETADKFIKHLEENNLI